MGAKNYKRIATEARKAVLGIIHRGQTSHVASNFSCIDIASVLYQNLRLGDEVVWSKGWVAATIYYFLYKQKKISWEDLSTFPKAPYFGLAEPSVNGVHVAGGSMGHGLPIAVGMALGKQKNKETGKIHCIISDGEMNEGTTWESAMIAHHHKLGNLVVWVDANKWQAMGKTDEVLNLEPIENRWRGFGWSVARINGHNFKEIERMTLLKNKGKPTVIICDTIKGKGVSFMENHLLYHYKHVTAEEYEKAMKELV